MGLAQAPTSCAGWCTHIRPSCRLSGHQRSAAASYTLLLPPVSPRTIVQSDPGCRQTGACHFSWKEEGIYESGWNKLMEKNYAKREWPEAKIIALLINDDQLFLILYRELYYRHVYSRHVYSRLQPNIDDRFHLYENSCELFNYLLNSIPLELPGQWLWDIVDEFIYQFQSFCVWRAKVKAKSDEELLMLADGTQAPFARVIVCYIATYYYIGLCYIMLRRYPDAIRAFVSIMNFILRMRQYHAQSYQYDQINKTADRMYALFVICNALSPSWLDGNIVNIMKDRYGEQFAKIPQS
ncbi:hypothetical protein EWM64_g5405 [Hericium alpestre]|uniref:Eukaryotic translation initiation factor 3 subunit L n=1 Tax=Hericium alpestre TaxID=135208 RepID=A0A4Y9ZX58_9AGAM|nr:hypothetical protein EWM64_g5405 [Hericium alpestre]